MNPREINHANKVPLGILARALVACATEPVTYKSVEDLAVAMEEAGFE